MRICTNTGNFYHNSSVAQQVLAWSKSLKDLKKKFFPPCCTVWQASLGEQRCFLNWSGQRETVF